MKHYQRSYEGVSLCAPITIPYRRYSPETAHWWAGAALKELRLQTNLTSNDIDGVIFSSFSSNPDTVVGIVQHLGLSPTWMDNIPTGGASGVMAIRRAARAVQRPPRGPYHCGGRARLQLPRNGPGSWRWQRGSNV